MLGGRGLELPGAPPSVLWIGVCPTPSPAEGKETRGEEAGFVVRRQQRAGTLHQVAPALSPPWEEAELAHDCSRVGLSRIWCWQMCKKRT